MPYYTRVSGRKRSNNQKDLTEDIQGRLFPEGSTESGNEEDNEAPRT